jgi:hypothetical protein
MDHGSGGIMTRRTALTGALLLIGLLSMSVGHRQPAAHAARDPETLVKNLTAAKQHGDQVATFLLAQYFKVDIQTEKGKIGSLTTEQLRTAMKAYEQLGESGRRKDERCPPSYLYELARFSYETLLSREGEKAITTAEHLKYADWLATSSNPLDGNRTARAYERVLALPHTPAQGVKALVGRHRALVLADQISPGSRLPYIIETVDRLRIGFPGSVEFCHILERTGEHYVWSGRADDARPYFLEAVERFGSSAPVALRRLAGKPVGFGAYVSPRERSR